MLNSILDSQRVSDKELMSVNDMTRCDMIVIVANTRPRVENMHLPNTMETKTLVQNGG